MADIEAGWGKGRLLENPQPVHSECTLVSDTKHKNMSMRQLDKLVATLHILLDLIYSICTGVDSQHGTCSHQSLQMTHNLQTRPTMSSTVNHAIIPTHKGAALFGSNEHTSVASGRL